MMNLNDLSDVAIDREGMLEHALNLPRTCSDAWELGQRVCPQLDLPQVERDGAGVKQIVIVGIGGSAIGGDLLAALIANEARCPIFVHRGYELPAYVSGSDTLVIGCSHSGNTEETLSAFAQARERGTLLLALTTGGELGRLAGEWGQPLLRYSYESQPRAALGFSLTLLLTLMCHLDCVGDKATDLTEAVDVMRAWQTQIGPEVPIARNRAKRLALSLMGRMPVIYGAGLMEPVARRWRTQFNENAKIWSFCDGMPELNHNAVVGYERSDLIRDQASVVILRSRHDSPRIQTRWRITSQMLTGAEVSNERVEARGESRLAQMLSLIHFGDLVSVYLALATGVDPTPVNPIAHLKEQLSRQR